ncbi:hypothetical protein GCM10027446_00430 [Angustibacter peucedani]
MRELHDHTDLLAASDGDAFVRWMVDPAVPLRGWALATGVAWVRRTPRRRTTLTVRADVDDAVRATAQLLAAAPEVDFVTLPRGAAEPLADLLDLRVGDDWDWMSTATPPPRHPLEHLVQPLGDADRDDVAALLSAASPRHSAEPDEPGVRWDGVRADDGRLVACAARQVVGPGVPHLASIATRPDVRGQGLGAAVTAAATRRGFDDGAPVVTLGMYADNAVARRLYERLGFVCEHRWSSRRRRAQRRRDGS